MAKDISVIRLPLTILSLPYLNKFCQEVLCANLTIFFLTINIYLVISIRTILNMDKVIGKNQSSKDKKTVLKIV